MTVEKSLNTLGAVRIARTSNKEMLATDGETGPPNGGLEPPLDPGSDATPDIIAGDDAAVSDAQGSSQPALELVPLSAAPVASAHPASAGASEPSTPATKLPSKLPNVTIAYKSISASYQIDAVGHRVANVLTPLVDLGRKIIGQAPKTTCFRIKNITGRIRPGTTTLILAPPGHGKSSLLRALANWLPIDTPGVNGVPADAAVRYNGLTSVDAEREGCSVRRLCSFVDQIDEHIALLTVRETLDFAHQCTSAVQDPERVPAVIKMLGLGECENTILGNALVRGVSGGQKRRVTVGEMLVGDARALFLDEYTNGLDTATAEDITRGLQAWTRATNGSVVVTAQQPTPGLFAQFDEIIVMGDSQIIYHGPRDDLLPFFASMGYVCPSDVDVCDFVIDCVSQPHVALQRLQDNARRSARAAGASAAAAAAAGAPNGLIESSLGTVAVSEGGPCTNIAGMVKHFESSIFHQAILDDIAPFFSGTFSALGGSDDKTGAVEPLLPTPEAQATYKTGFVMPVSTLFGMVFRRQVAVYSRNWGVTLPRYAQSTFMGLIYGSVYYGLGLDMFMLRIAVFVMCISEVAFGNLVELPVSVEAKHIVVRQGVSGFYPPWLYVVSATILAFPTFIGEVLCMGLPLYFMSDCYRGAAEAVLFFVLVMSQSFIMSIWFRFTTAVTDTETSALAVSASVTNIFTMLSGFFVTKSAMPIWLQWLMWVSPMSWTVRALANNEFLSARYPRAVGEAYLRAVDMPVGKDWIGYNFLFCFGVGFIFVALHGIALKHPFYEGSRGTTRTDEAEVVETEAEIEAEQAFERIEDAKEESRLSQVHDSGLRGSFSGLEASGSRGSGDHDGREHSSIMASGAAANKNVLRTLREALPFSPVWLSFRDIRYTVQVKDPEGRTVDRALLRGINGYAEPGKLMALMGASGAGKTTLLDVLAGRKNMGKIEGEIKLNGRVATVDEVSYHTGYVEQFDSLFPFDTVRETLLFAAELRLPSSVPREVKQEIVDEVLDVLELTGIAGIIIGSHAMPSLSPSQLKRVNIGCELVANPAVLFLDEPTTGLDSRSAQTVMRVVRRIARSGRSVICTIHQPSAELFYLFDRLVLLASGGHQVFFGGLGQRSKRFVAYLQSIEGVAPCPPRYNPASWMLEEMGVGQTSGKPEGIVGASRYDDSKVIIKRFKAAWEASKQSASAMYVIDELDKTAEREGPDQTPRVEYGSAADAHAHGRAHGGESDAEADVEADAEAGPAGAGAGADDEEAPAGVGAAPAPVVSMPTGRGKAPLSAVAAEAGPASGRRSRSSSFSANTSVVAAMPHAASHVAPKEAHPFYYAFWLVQVRTFNGFWRNPAMVVYRAISCVLVSIVLGLIYFQLSVKSQATAVALCSVMAMTTIYGSINVCSVALPFFTENRVVMYRELSSSMYKAWMWGFSLFTTELLFTGLTSFFVIVPAYFFAGLDADPKVFFEQFLSVYVYALSLVSMSCLLAGAMPNLAVGEVVQSVYLGVFIMLSGIAVPFPELPRGWVWLFRALPTSHMTEASVMSQVGTCSPLPNCGPTISVLDGATTSTQYLAAYIEKYLGFGFDGYGNAIGWMVLFIVVVQILACLALTFMNFSRR